MCISLVREKKTEKPPKLYDLTTLQREANRVFGYTAKQTLDYAQSLYEKKLLTYPDGQPVSDRRHGGDRPWFCIWRHGCRPSMPARSFSPMFWRW